MIWIRSQDRVALMKCNDIQITDNNEIINGNPFDEYSLLGIYKTKQRALEVLDEVERYIIGKVIIPTHKLKYDGIHTNPVIEDTVYDRIEYLPTVYQMPKD